jgi:hypothetical protein
MDEQDADLLKDIDTFWLMYYLDGATIGTIPYLNMMCSGVHNFRAVLDIFDCTNHMANGGIKNASYISSQMRPSIDRLSGVERTALFVFDRASNVQKAGKILNVIYPRSTTIAAAEHTVATMFSDWSNTPEFKLMIESVKKVTANYGGPKHALGALMKKHSRNMNEGRLITFTKAVDS